MKNNPSSSSNLLRIWTLEPRPKMTNLEKIRTRKRSTSQLEKNIEIVRTDPNLEKPTLQATKIVPQITLRFPILQPLEKNSRRKDKIIFLSKKEQEKMMFSETNPTHSPTRTYSHARITAAFLSIFHRKG